MPCRLERNILGNNENRTSQMMNDYVHLSMIDRNVAKQTNRNEWNEMKLENEWERERCWMLKSISIENNSKAINRHAIGILLVAINGQILSLCWAACLTAFVRPCARLIVGCLWALYMSIALLLRFNCIRTVSHVAHSHTHIITTETDVWQ